MPVYVHSESLSCAVWSYVLMCMNSYNGIITSLSPLHILQKGDLNAVKVLVAFGASVNATNNRGQTPLDLATVGYLNQERKLSLSNTSLNQHLMPRNSRESLPRLPHQRSFTENHRESPLLSRIVLKQSKFVDMELSQLVKTAIEEDADGVPSQIRVS